MAYVFVLAFQWGLAQGCTISEVIQLSLPVENIIIICACALKIVNEYDQEIPQSQTADNPVAP